MTDFSQQFFGGADTAANIAGLAPSFATPATGPAYLLGIYYLSDQGALKFWYNGAFHDLSTLLANFTLTGVISPTALSASVNDYNPTGLATCAIMRQDSDAAHSITGITAPSIGGQTIFFANISSFTITLTDQDAASSAANRFDLGGTDLAVTASQLIVLQYDATTARWRAVAGGGGGGSGTVTSVGTSGGLTGGPITTTGTIDLAAVTNHAVCLGTGSAGALGTAAPSTSGYVLTDNGASSDPSFQAPALILIGSTITSASATDVSFTSISGSYKDLILTIHGRSQTAASEDYIHLRFNSDTGANYNYVLTITTDNTSPGRSSGLAQTSITVGGISAASGTANYAGGSDILIPNYAGTTFYKNVLMHCANARGTGAGTNALYDGGASWASTSAISTIKVYLQSGAAFVDGSVVSLWART